MAEWEYCVLTWTAGIVSSEQKEDLQKAGFQGRLEEAADGGAVAQLGNIEYLGKDKNEQTVDLGKTLARLGGEGWEMLQIVPTGGGRQQFWFKRSM